MTREEAIAILNHKVSACLRGTKWGEALDIAIKALEQEPCEEAISRQAALDALEWKWAGKAAIDAIKDLPPVTPHLKYEDIAKAFQFGLAFGFGKKHDEMDRVINEIKKVITPQQKMGRWIEENINEWSRKVFCSKCGCTSPFEHVSNGDIYSASGYGVNNKTKFCPNCGARMEEQE